MSRNTKPANRPVKQRWLIGLQSVPENERDARGAVDVHSAAREALAAAFLAPAPEASRAQVTVRRKRVVLRAREEPDKRPAEADPDARSPRVFRLTTSVLSGEAGAAKGASPNAEPVPGEASAQDALTVATASPLERIGHDRRARTIRRSVLPPASEGERANEAELLSQKSTLLNRIMKLTDCANALREAQRRQLAAWVQVEARVERISRQMRGLRNDRTYCSFVPLASATFKMLSELGELARQLDVMQRTADDMRVISRQMAHPEKPKTLTSSDLRLRRGRRRTNRQTG